MATQAPVPDTFEDFWRLIWEQESAAIVMLTREEEAGKVRAESVSGNFQGRKVKSTIGKLVLVEART